MKIIEPFVELWLQPSCKWQDQVARAARLCYAQNEGKRSSDDLCEFLISRGHTSMLRHGTAYFYLSYKGDTRMVTSLYVRLISSPYVGLIYRNNRVDGEIEHHYFISTNMQFLHDNPKIYKFLKDYEVSLTDFIATIKRTNFPVAFNLLRYTVCVTTQIGTSRELNRTSPNCISEQSTRYVYFGKRGGVTFVRPYWWNNAGWGKKLLAKMGWKTSEIFYNLWLRLGFPPEAARNFLMLEAGTRVAYTYNLFEWKHILDLRLVGTTGKPHPDAQEAAKLIYNEIVRVIRNVNPNADIQLSYSRHTADGNKAASLG